VIGKCLAGLIPDLQHLAMRDTRRVVRGILKETMRDVERAAIDHPDDLTLTVEALIPDTLRGGDAGLVRPGGADVVVHGFRHFFDDLDLR
jgi:hypothetical protein